MDIFEIETLERNEKRIKRKIVEQLNCIQINDKNLQNQSKLINMVLDYSPKITYTNKNTIFKKKIKLKENNNDNDEIDNLKFEKKNSINLSHHNSSLNNNNICININNNVNNNNNNNNIKKEYNNHKINIYLFGTQNKLEIFINNKIKFENLKKMVFKQLQNDKNLKLKYDNINGYEFRYCNENNILPNFNIDPLNNDDIINDNISFICFVEKENFNNNENKNIDNKNNINEKINLTVYLSLNKKFNIKVSPNETLREVFEKILDKIYYKNIDLYYFLEHSEKNFLINDEEIDDNYINLKLYNNRMDKELNMDYKCKYLNEKYEIDLLYKNFWDLPQRNYKQINQLNNSIKKSPNNNTLIKYKTQNFNYLSNSFGDLNDSFNENLSYNNDNEYIFNDATAGVYKEYEVIKINRYKTKQEIILGIDLYNLYNHKPYNKKSFFKKNVKKPSIKIEDIIDIYDINEKSFSIKIKEKNNMEKINTYEVKNINEKNEIISKIKYLMKNHNK